MKTKMNNAVRCFAHVHMTLAEYGLWNLCRELSYKSGVLLLDGRNMAQRFADTSKDSIYRTINALAGKGWLVLLDPKKRGMGGQYDAARYKVLSHDDWTGLRGCAECIEQRTPQPPAPVRKVTPPAPVADLRSACRTGETDLSQNRPSPVAPVRHNLNTSSEENLSEGEQSETPGPEACPECEIDAPTDAQKGLNSQTVSPVAPVRQAESVRPDPQAEAEENDGWHPDCGQVPVDWIDRLSRPALVAVPEDAD